MSSKNFFNIFSKLTINIPLIDALEQMPNYARFMKQILSKKKRLEEFIIMAMNEEYSVVL